MEEQYLQALKGRKVLVTGATGFTGSVLVRRLVNAGADVRAIVRSASDMDRRLWDVNIRWFQGDVFDPAVVQAAAKDVEYIFHLASSLRNPDTPDDVQRQVHVTSTQWLARAALANPAFQRFIHVSTIGVHGNITHPPADENTPLAPGDSYQQTKAEGETWFRDFAVANKLPFTVIRPCGIYGPGDTRLLKLFKIASLPFATLPGKSACHYHLIHVDDLVDALVVAATHPAALNETFICGNPDSMPLEQIVRIAAKELGNPIRIFRMPVWPLTLLAVICEDVCNALHIKPPLYRRRVAFFTKNRTFNTSKIRTRLGFSPKYSDEDGIAQTGRWYVEHGWLKSRHAPASSAPPSPTASVPSPAVPRKKSAARLTWMTAVAAVLGLGMLIALHTGGKFIRAQWMHNLLWLIPVWLLVERLRHKGEFKTFGFNLRWHAPLVVLAVLMCLCLFSSAGLHKWFFFMNWPPGAGLEAIHSTSTLTLWILGAVVLAPLMLVRRQRLWMGVLGILAASQVMAFHHLLQFTHGQALYRDDHPSMMFRLWEVGQTWPQLMNYLPHWNAGAVDYAGTASGVNALGLMMKPLLAFWGIHEVYTPFLGAAFIVGVPLLAMLSVRLMGGRRLAALCAGILSMGVSQHFFLWLLHYGTVGACFSTAFILPFSACVFRVVWMDRREWWLFILMIVSFLLLTQWPPGMLMAAVIGVSALAGLRQWTKNKTIFLVAGGIVAVLFLYRTLGLLIFGGGEEFFGFLFHSPAPIAPASASAPAMDGLWLKGWTRLVSHLHEINPLIVFLGLLGAFVYPRKSIRGWFVPAFLLLAGITGWVSILKPHLELGRMAITLAFLAVVPAALATEKILRTDHFRLSFLRAALVSLLLLTGWNVSQFYAGRGKAPLTYLSQATEQLADFIAKNTPPGERAVFVGPAVHGYGDHGHVALLPYLTGRELMACDYYHFSPEIVEYHYPPQPFRVSPEKMMEFMNDYNVSLVIARNDNLIRQLNLSPREYEPLATHPEWKAYRVLRKPTTLFLKGQGTVAARFNRIDVTTTDPGAETVLKYNWQDGLAVKPPVRIRPYPVDKDFALIQVIWNGEKACSIRFTSIW